MMSQRNTYSRRQNDASQMRDHINQMTTRLQTMLDSRRELLDRLRRGERIDLDAATEQEERELSDMMVRMVGK